MLSLLLEQLQISYVYLKPQNFFKTLLVIMDVLQTI